MSKFLAGEGDLEDYPITPVGKTLRCVVNYYHAWSIFK